ncbi:hypothetical protein [Rhizobium etli]|uniref:hypothetical protein n=1 Tax=Rhizobium etli TaxID=29449 RepID=UPI0012BCB825|nr:hypothetical protein [Rhizobium etli]
MLAAHGMKQIFHIAQHRRFQTARLIVFNRLKLKRFEQSNRANESHLLAAVSCQNGPNIPKIRAQLWRRRK